MNWVAVLALGFVLGLRHATDADHVVVLSTLLQREPGTARAVRLAMLWGAGHTLSFLSLGLLIVIAGVRIPSKLEMGIDLLVSAMLIGLGSWHLLNHQRTQPTRDLWSIRLTETRPLLIGLVHGLAGSTAVALLVVSTIESPELGVAYLGLVACGTVLGMALLTALLSQSIAWATKRGGGLARLTSIVAAALSIALGCGLLWRVITSDLNVL